jgi:RNA 2',3'-cyclic 3'-phosphodiesterase
LRLFVALDPPDALRGALAAVQGDLTVGRRLDPDSFHLTLAFLGEVDPDTAEEVHVALEVLSAPGFSLALSGIGTLGGEPPAVGVAEVADAGPVTALHRAVRRALRSAGVELARQRFRPHVTLARLPRRMHGGELGDLRMFLARNGGFRADPFQVTSFALYASTLSPGGALHEELARYPLR